MYNELKRVPGYSKQELLLYILEQNESIAIKIITNSGHEHRGNVLHLHELKHEGDILMLQLIDFDKKTTNNVLHISMDKLESIEFLEDHDVLKVLSRGTFFKQKEYEVSGKLQVKKALQKFSDAIFETTDVQVGVPNVTFPTDGKQLNRMLQLTELLQRVMLEILKEEDARISWKSNYSNIAFIESDKLKVIKNNDTMEIHFAFTNLELPEIPIEEVTTEILGVL